MFLFMTNSLRPAFFSMIPYVRLRTSRVSGTVDTPLCARRCPHRAAALSQGVLTPSGNLQCAYHGWSFDASGACKNIPQLPSGGLCARYWRLSC